MVFVADPFYGDAFDHLSTLTTSIIGPRLLLFCLSTGREVPNMPYPLYTATMLGISVSFTGLDGPHLARLQSLVQLMSGTVSKDYHDGVTHLVAAKVRAFGRQWGVWLILNRVTQSPTLNIGWKPQVWSCDLARCADHETSLGGRSLEAGWNCWPYNCLLVSGFEYMLLVLQRAPWTRCWKQLIRGSQLSAAHPFMDSVLLSPASQGRSDWR